MTTLAPPAPARLPPGPRFPRWLQTLGFLTGGVRYLEWCRRRYGEVVTMGTLFDERFVMLFDPVAVKELFQGSADGLHAGEANALLGPIVGERSVLLLDGAEHLRHRRLLLPPFHGKRMLAHVETMRACADAEIDRWPVGEPFTLLDSMQSLTLRVILRAVFGYAPGAEEDELARRLRAMVEPLSRARGVVVLNAVVRGRNQRASAQRFEERKRAVDEIIYAEIGRRRADPDLAERDDVFSELLLPATMRGWPSPTARSATSCSRCCSPATRRRRPGWPGPSTSCCMTRACRSGPATATTDTSTPSSRSHCASARSSPA